MQEVRKKNADTSRVLSLLRSAVRNGNANAAYALGTWFLHGIVVKKNVRKAARLLREASNGNVSDASYDLAVCYEKGIGVRKNPRRAAGLYFKAALYGRCAFVVRSRQMFSLRNWRK